MYFVYVLYDKKLKKFYIGVTKDIERRLREHKRGNTLATKNFQNFDLVYYEACICKEDAYEREKQLKTGFGRGYINRRISNYLQSL